MNNQDYEMATQCAAGLEKNDFASLIIRFTEEGEIKVGAFGDVRGIDRIYNRIARSYLLTLSQEMLDEFIHLTASGLN